MKILASMNIRLIFFVGFLKPFPAFYYSKYPAGSASLHSDLYLFSILEIDLTQGLEDFVLISGLDDSAHYFHQCHSKDKWLWARLYAEFRAY